MSDGTENKLTQRLPLYESELLQFRCAINFFAVSFGGLGVAEDYTILGISSYPLIAKCNFYTRL